MSITTKTYDISILLPSEEKFGLVSQMRRSAISIPSNIAEGAGRRSNGEFKQFSGIANGSANELYTQLILTTRLQLLKEQKIKSLLEEIIEVQKMNYSLMNTLS